VARLTAARVPAGRVNGIPEAVALATALGLEPTVVVPGRTRQVRHPVRWSAHEVAAPSPPPALGEHDAAVRAWLSARQR
jgi:crotonobetainyl-CoA:carnitine CoA-transferase CaiB-like acyl-CoA transferase